MKLNGQLEPVPFEQAFQHVAQRLTAAGVNETLVMSSGSYSNETLYLLQRLARIALNTNALNTFDYYRRGTDFFPDKNDILPFAELFQSNKFYCIFPNAEKGCQGVSGEAPAVWSSKMPETLKAVFEILKRCPDTPRYWFNSTDTLCITDYYAFFRCVNYYMIRHHLEKGIYVEVLGKNYGIYKNALMEDDYDALLKKNNLQHADIQSFVDDLITVHAPAFLVWERWLTASAYHELENMCMLLDIQSKPAAGFLTIKGELNSQGLYDMGLFPHIAPGGHHMDEEARHKMEAVFQAAVCTESVDVASVIDGPGFRNVILWNALGSDIAEDILHNVRKAEFSLLHTSYLPGNAELYDVILPANLPEEVSGSYTDTAKVPHNYESEIDNPLEYNNIGQLFGLAKAFGIQFPSDKDEAFLEFISFMEAGCHSAERHYFK